MNAVKTPPQQVCLNVDRFQMTLDVLHVTLEWNKEGYTGRFKGRFKCFDSYGFAGSVFEALFTWDSDVIYASDDIHGVIYRLNILKAGIVTAAEAIEWVDTMMPKMLEALTESIVLYEPPTSVPVSTMETEWDVLD